MSHETVSLYLGGLDPRSPYFPYIRERNGAIASHISRYLGLDFDPQAHLIPPDGKRYIVPGKTIDAAEACLLQIENTADFYGGVVPEFGMVGKTILHPSVSTDTPGFYSHAFAKKVTDNALVLPGVTAFGRQEILETFGQLPGAVRYRLKAANESDGNGQHIIRDSQHLMELLQELDNDLLRSVGMVIEPNLERDRRTVSAGVFQIGADNYSFAADQLNDVDNGRDRYLGAREVTVARGGLADLSDILHVQSDSRHDSVRKAAFFHDLFLQYYPVVASRLSYDVLEGSSAGVMLSGITDITARLGGTCPALILAAEYLHEHPSAEATTGQVNLNYHPETVMPEESGAVEFLSAPTLRITAKIDRVL